MQFAKIPPPLLAVLTALTMPLSIYLHLGIDKKGLTEIAFKDLTNAWPIFPALLAIVFLGLGGFMATLNPRFSHRLAWFGVGFGCLYYVMSFASLCLVSSVVMFMVPWTYLFFAPVLFLFATMRRLQQAQKSEIQI